MDLSRERVFITGGSSGIGRALAIELRKRGAAVAVCGRSEERLAALAQACPGVVTLPFDLARIDDLPALAKEIEEAIGPPSMLINSAGIQVNDEWLDQDADARVEAIRREITVNFMSPLVLTALLLDSLVSVPGARVVSVTSVLAWKPKRSAPVYSATKSALRTFTDGMRYQLGPASGVSLVEVVPPLVETAMTEGRGSGKITAEEAAARIAEGLERGRERIYVGKAKLISRLYRVSPELVGRILRHG